MAKIRCISLDGGALYSNQYTGPSGKEYIFHRGSSIDIKIREDADHFLKCGKGTLFKKVTKTGELIKDLKDALAEVAKELPWTKKDKAKKAKIAEDEKSDAEKVKAVKAEKIAKEKLEKAERAERDAEKAKRAATKAEKEAEEAKEEVEKLNEEAEEKEEKTEESPEEEKEEKQEELKEEENPMIKKHTGKEAWDMSKKEQINLLKELGSTEIPKLEKDRVELILELEKKA